MLERDRATLIVVDVQEAFRLAVEGFDEVAANTGVLVQGCRTMGVPVVVTEQYPRGLGETVAEVAEHLGGVPRLEKTAFSAARAEGFDLAGRNQALVCGIEAHVCVSQTVLDLLDDGLEVQVVGDAVSSRLARNRDLALERLARAGAVVTSAECALFELLERAGTEEFKTVQRLVL
jgi:nicotinamidase-related amidase